VIDLSESRVSHYGSDASEQQKESPPLVKSCKSSTYHSQRVVNIYNISIHVENPHWKNKEKYYGCTLQNQFWKTVTWTNKGVSSFNGEGAPMGNARLQCNTINTGDLLILELSFEWDICMVKHLYNKWPNSIAGKRWSRIYFHCLKIEATSL
jgi:hypothetical protein